MTRQNTPDTAAEAFHEVMQAVRKLADTSAAPDANDTTMRVVFLLGALELCVEQGGVWKRKVDRPEYRLFPIQGDRHSKGGRIPWTLAERAYRVYCGNHGHSLTIERLAERGGFSVGELLSLGLTPTDVQNGLRDGARQQGS